MSMDWQKLYVEARTDAKLRSLTDAQHRVWFNLLCFVGEQAPRGTVPAMRERILAIEVAGGDADLLREAVAALVDLDILRGDPDGSLTFINYDKRQHRKPGDEPDRVAQRQRDSRARRCDAQPVTPMSHPCHTPSRDVTPLDTEREEEREEEGDAEKENPPSGGAGAPAHVMREEPDGPEPFEDGPYPTTPGPDDPDLPVDTAKLGGVQEDSAPPPRPTRAAPKPKRHDYTAAFEEFWRLYPGPGVKADAFRAWKAAGIECDDELREQARRGLVAEIDHRDRATAAQAWQPNWKHASTWLSEAAWDQRPWPIEPGSLGRQKVVPLKGPPAEQQDPDQKYAWW